MTEKQPCPTCGGAGQISFFKRVSRFLLSCEECPECASLGIRLDPPEEQPVNRESPPRPQRGPAKANR